MSLRNTIPLFVVCALAIPGVGTAQSHDADHRAVDAAVQALSQAMLHADGPALERLASAKLSYGHSSGNMETKEEFVQTFVSGASVFEDIQLSDQTIQIEGSTAIVRHKLSARTNDPGKGPASIQLGIVLVWVKQADGTWQLLARQAFKLP